MIGWYEWGWATVLVIGVVALFWSHPVPTVAGSSIVGLVGLTWPRRSPWMRRFRIMSIIVLSMGLFISASESPLWLGVATLLLIVLTASEERAWGGLVPLAGALSALWIGSPALSHGLGASLILLAGFGVGLLWSQNRSQVKGQTARAQMLQEDVLRLTTTDALTGLSNRAVMEQLLNQAISEARPFALIVLDIARFSYLYSVYGPALGDEVIRRFAERLVTLLEDGDQAFRTTADTFVVSVKAPKNKVGLAHMVAHWQKTLTEPYPLASATIDLTVSAGVVLHPDHGRDLETLLGNAGTALLRAKKAGPNAYRFYYHLPPNPSVEGPELRWALKEAIRKGHLTVYYQPQVSLETGGVMGVEALARWEHPDWGFVSPSVFVPAAEEAGLITEIGDWVLEQALQDVKEVALPPGATLSINFSAAQFVRPDMADRVQDTVTRLNFDPQRLVLEVTESLTIDSVPRVIDKLQALRAFGVRISVDDFGTRYASLSYLKTFPVDELKIDKSFVADIVKYPAIPSAIVTLARHMNIAVVAEGIETEAQADYLRLLGCPVAQGYLYGKPMPKETLATWLKVAL